MRNNLVEKIVLIKSFEVYRKNEHSCSTVIGKEATIDVLTAEEAIAMPCKFAALSSSFFLLEHLFINFLHRISSSISIV